MRPLLPSLAPYYSGYSGSEKNDTLELVQNCDTCCYINLDHKIQPFA